MVDFNEESTSQYGYATLAKISALVASKAWTWSSGTSPP